MRGVLRISPGLVKNVAHIGIGTALFNVVNQSGERSHEGFVLARIVAHLLKTDIIPIFV